MQNVGETAREVLDGVEDLAEDLAFNLYKKKQCVLSFNTYFDPSTNASGILEIKSPFENLKRSSRDCCRSCQEQEGCNAWQWCPVEVGCMFPRGNASMSIVQSPYLGCHLLQLDGFSGYTRNIEDIRSMGPDVPFIAGSLPSVGATLVPGYDAFPGSEVGPSFDFPCNLTMYSFIQNENDQSLVLLEPQKMDSKTNHSQHISFDSSPEFGCVIEGSVELASLVCSTLDTCTGFIHYRNGFDAPASGRALVEVPFPGGSVGVLKSEHVNDTFIASMELNPRAVIYIKSYMLNND